MSRSRRPGFTLLEVLLATAIGLLLMAALYVAVDVQLRHAQHARDIVEEATLARALLARMGHDIMPALAPPLPTPTASSAGAAATASPTSGTTGGTTSSTPTSTATAAPTTGTAATGASTVLANIGIKGDATRLTVIVSRATRDLNLNLESPEIFSDQRLILYWLITGGDQPVGLARMEVKAVTSEEAAALLPPDVPDELSHLLAEEVKSLSFQYFNGTEWVESWDGTAAGSDGVTPMGPPAAVAILIGIQARGLVTTATGEPNLKFYRHVIAIPTANGTALTTTTGTTGQ
jgi:prepilin-type N-terminal cleavage/methylation domain-containing protein